MTKCTIPNELDEQEEAKPQEQVADLLEGTIAEYVLHFEFLIINNEAKYEALAIGLKIAKELGI